MIKYLGSKRVLLPILVDWAQSLENVSTILDLFSGTSRVGHAFKQAGFQVTANDINTYAYTLAKCYVQADRDLWLSRAERLLNELRRIPPCSGYFTHTYCEQSRFFHPRNGARIDAIREYIHGLDLEPELEAIALVSLMEAADRVDSTTGVQMAYLKSWASRAHNDLELRLPATLPGQGQACHKDALEMANGGFFDLVYLDPPYNQHAYLGNYHIWESLIRWDKPEVYGIACKRIDCKTRKSDYNSKRKITGAMQSLVRALDTRHLLVSFNNEGYLDREEMVNILSERGKVTVKEIPFERYVGAKIGIYNPEGTKVGKVSHTKNVEYLFHVNVEQPPIQ